MLVQLTASLPRNRLGLFGYGLRALRVAIRDDNMRAALSRQQRNLTANAATTANDQRNPSLNSFSGGWRRIFASSSFQYSMRNASLGGSAT